MDREFIALKKIRICFEKGVYIRYTPFNFLEGENWSKN
jgi:hypothetical protein